MPNNGTKHLIAGKLVNIPRGFIENSRKRNTIYDIGAEDGHFVAVLRQIHARNPMSNKPKREKIVMGVDRDPKAAGIIRQSMGNFFGEMTSKEAEKIHSVWLNHVELMSKDANAEFQELAKKIQPGVPIIITIRAQYLQPTLASINGVGLEVVHQGYYKGKGIASKGTKKFLDESRHDPLKAPIRIIAMKPIQ
jgi:hypothetical protein